MMAGASAAGAGSAKSRGGALIALPRFFALGGVTVWPRHLLARGAPSAPSTRHLRRSRGATPIKEGFGKRRFMTCAQRQRRGMQRGAQATLAKLSAERGAW